MCLGVARRGNLDEEDWFGERKEFHESYNEDPFLNEEEDDAKTGNKDMENLQEGPSEVEGERTKGQRSLLYWMGKQLMATRCSNEGAVIEWILVPFIVEDEEEVDSSSSNSTHEPTVIVTKEDPNQSEDEEL
jgi:hypothetical protein